MTKKLIKVSKPTQGKGYSIDLTGRVFDRLTVLSFAGVTPRGQSVWNCKCTCDNLTRAIGAKLKGGRTKSCGVGLCRYQITDMSGQVIGRLTVIGPAEKKGDWECRCECSRVVVVSGTSLRSGTHMCHHCGTNQKYLIGQVFGKLTVISRIGTDHNDHVVWGCHCTCGRLTKTTTHQLTKDRTRSCGRPECKFDLQKGEASFNALFDSYRRRAAKKGLEFELTRERFRELTQESCHYCGDLPSQQTHSAKTNGHFTYTGIDRLDNNLGYIEGNMVPCCGGCNRAKKTGRAKDHLDWIDSLTTPQSSQAINLVVEDPRAGA